MVLDICIAYKYEPKNTNMTRMNEKASVVSKAHLAFKLLSFWLNAFRDGDGQEKKVCEEWNTFCREKGFNSIAILLSAAADSIISSGSCK